MLRTAFGAFDALVGGNAARSNMTRGALGREVWTSRVTTKVPVAPWHKRALMSQLRASKPVPTRSTFGRFRSPLSGPRRQIHSSRARQTDKSSTNENTASQESLSLSGRLKKLSREYGWTAVGVYLALSVLDFPFCFLLVRTVGTEKIAHLEDVVVSYAQRVIPEGIQNFWREYRHSYHQAREARTGEIEIVGHGVAEAQERSKQEGASLATQLALAYAIHKSFIFLRVPLTAAVTPKIVKVLRSWGYQIGKRKSKP